MTFLLRILSIVWVCCMVSGCRSDRPRLVLTWSPKNAIVQIDGFEAAEYRSPHTFVFFRPGRYRLDISADGYLPIAMMLDVTEGVALKKNIALVPDATVPKEIDTVPGLDEKGVSVMDRKDDLDSRPVLPTRPWRSATEFGVLVESVPDGATIHCRRLDTGEIRLCGMTPREVFLKSGGSWEIAISKAGYQSIRRTVVSPESRDRVVVREQLVRLDSHSDTPMDSVPLPANDSDPHVRPPVSSGWLSVRTDPSATISIDGKVIGKTPVVSYPISAGSHTILMENRDVQKRKVKVIHVQPGQHLHLDEEL